MRLTSLIRSLIWSQMRINACTQRAIVCRISITRLKRPTIEKKKKNTRANTYTTATIAIVIIHRVTHDASVRIESVARRHEM